MVEKGIFLSRASGHAISCVVDKPDKLI